MDKETFLQKLESGPVGAENKAEIKALIEKSGWNIKTIEQIKDIIQKDIEGDDVEFSDEDKAQISSVNEELVTELSGIEQILGEDMSYVESEMNDLETMTGELNKAVDQTEIDSIKADIAA